MNSFIKSKFPSYYLFSPCIFTDSPGAASENRILTSAASEGRRSKAEEGSSQYRFSGSFSHYLEPCKQS